MAWLEVHLSLGVAQCEAVEDALNECGALAITLTDAEDHPLLEPGPGEMPLWPHIELNALFEADQSRAEIVAALTRPELNLGAAQIRFRELEDQDWVRAWMDRYVPMQFGRRLWIVPSNHSPPDPDAINIQLDPGLAFGTGTHATTALCLEWLDGQSLQGQTIIDYGCGSGILAIAALRLGATAAIGIDIDPQALLASRDNAQRNQVSEQLDLYLPQHQPAALRAPVLVANILAAPLIALAPDLMAMLESGGRFALSGILAGQESEVMQAWAAAGATELTADSREGWMRVSGRLNA